MTNTLALEYGKQLGRVRRGAIPVDRELFPLDIWQQHLNEQCGCNKRSKRLSRTTSMSLKEVLDERERNRAFIIQFLLKGLTFSEKKLINLLFFREYKGIKHVEQRLKLSSDSVEALFSSISMKMRANAMSVR